MLGLWGVKNYAQWIHNLSLIVAEDKARHGEQQQQQKLCLMIVFFIFSFPFTPKAIWTLISFVQIEHEEDHKLFLRRFHAVERWEEEIALDMSVAFRILLFL